MASLRCVQIKQRMRVLPEIPPFEKWRITTERYLQYMANLHHVHRALEDTVAAIVSAPRGASACI